NELEIGVAETGIGIQQNELDKVFDRFYQGETRQSRVGEGTGIGLQYVKEVVELKGGNVSVSSTPGHGSVFTLLLPISTEAIIAPVIDLSEKYDEVPFMEVGVEEEVAQVERPRLLIAEDNPDLVQLLYGQLSRNYQITVCDNGQDALQKSQEEVPDLVLSDIMMPKMDGFELLDGLKNDARTSHIPVVLLTAKSDVESRIEGLHRGADSYLGKPFDARELKAILKNLIESRKEFVERYNSGKEIVVSHDPELQQEDEFILKFHQVFRSNMDNSDFGIEEYCKNMGMSRSQIYHKLKALTGQSTANYIRKLRLLEAVRLLENKQMNISEVAYAVGFSSHSYFTKSFVSEFGKNPSEYIQHSK
ncbi:MAG: response regulator, partial [Bacteroidota bacterium]